MTANVFLFSTVLTQERLSWIDQALKYYTQPRKSADSPVASEQGVPGISIFLTGDALYSLNEAESRHIWASLLSMPGVRIVCNGDALAHRGISLDPLVERFPDQVITLPAGKTGGSTSFWSEILSAMPDRHPNSPREIGWLLLSSPYMFPSAGDAIQCLSAALTLGYGIGLYGYLDGTHSCHTGQITGDRENIGESLEQLAKLAAENQLPCSLMIHRYSAAARGYQSWDDGLGTVGSSFLIKPAHIRDAGMMIHKTGNIPVLFSENAGYSRIGTAQQPEENFPATAPVTILVTHSPYSTEYAFGGIAFAVACAHQGIRSRVIFLEDGVYALTGEHRAPGGDEAVTLPELIRHLSGNTGLQFFTLSPSLHMRGVLKNGTLAAVREIGFEELSALLFPRRAENGTGHERILFF